MITTIFVRGLLTTAVVGAGLLGGPGTGVAGAERFVLPDVVQVGDTADGWRFTLTMSELRVDSVPNLATSPFTKEGFVTAKVTATVEGAGSLSVNSGTLVLGVQLGCQVDVSEGLELGVDPAIDVFNYDSGSGSFEDPEFDVWPEVDTKLHAGSIEVVGLGAKRMKSNTATISVRDAHVEVSECGGPVTVRMFASAAISTDSSDDSLNAYGAPSGL
ncbi:MAG: MspA family porin [Mycobacterium sp.]